MFPGIIEYLWYNVPSLIFTDFFPKFFEKLGVVRF